MPSRTVDERRSLPMTLMNARECVMQRFRRILTPYGLTEQQWRVLYILESNPGLDGTELAERASVLSPSLSRIIKSLAKRKFVTIGKDHEDRRWIIVDITPAGSAIMEKIATERSLVYEGIEARFGKKRLDDLLDILDSFIESEKLP
jgi:homoprotocatechuate degradation regulator HpaR